MNLNTSIEDQVLHLKNTLEEILRENPADHIFKIKVVHKYDYSLVDFDTVVEAYSYIVGNENICYISDHDSLLVFIVEKYIDIDIKLLDSSIYANSKVEMIQLMQGCTYIGKNGRLIKRRGEIPYVAPLLENAEELLWKFLIENKLVKNAKII